MQTSDGTFNVWLARLVIIIIAIMIIIAILIVIAIVNAIITVTTIVTWRKQYFLTVSTFAAKATPPEARG